ncbi:MAG: TIGR00289 family protein [Methanocellales archaeon]|nr:TIGR00289 family protein [Methanocellales archaeon]MDD3291525.1 TIGR00289 family protein [Methanocellales archaeon]MDD5235915.1 TIGR00289 family protein [Methanocellales archaeon]MDD5485307.1 TIGR00289 family protein [Methanocellales archaeon]
MKLAALISGGKDSAFAMYKALQEGHEITDLITIKSKNPSSYMYHTPNIHLTELFSRLSGIPLLIEESPGEKECELGDLERALYKVDVEGVVLGAIESEYQASRVERICNRMGLEVYAPLWHQDPEVLLREMIKSLDILITHVAALGLNESWLGRKMDEKTIEDLKILNQRYGVHICGEGGEYETLVTDAPFFSKKIELVTTKKKWYGDHGTLEILETRLVDK